MVNGEDIFGIKYDKLLISFVNILEEINIINVVEE
jgi:hypothetical protein